MKSVFAPLLLSLLLVFPHACKAAAATPDAGAPARCLAEAARAIDEADVAAFERQVDVDAILEQALGLVMQAVAEPGATSLMPPLLALVFSQAAGNGGAAVRELLKGEARAFILGGVASGAFAGRKPSGGAGGGLLAPLFADASQGRKEIREAGAPVRDGEGWLMPVVVHDAGNGQDYAVTGRFSPTETGCRLTSVENLGEILERIRRESLAD